MRTRAERSWRGLAYHDDKSIGIRCWGMENLVEGQEMAALRTVSLALRVPRWGM